MRGCQCHQCVCPQTRAALQLLDELRAPGTRPSLCAGPTPLPHLRSDGCDHWSLLFPKLFLADLHPRQPTVLHVPVRAALRQTCSPPRTATCARTAAPHGPSAPGNAPSLLNIQSLCPRRDADPPTLSPPPTPSQQVVPSCPASLIFSLGFILAAAA